MHIAPQKIKWLTCGFWRGATRYEITRVNPEVNSNLHVEQPALSRGPMCEHWTEFCPGLAFHCDNQKSADCKRLRLSTRYKMPAHLQNFTSKHDIFPTQAAPKHFKQIFPTSANFSVSIWPYSNYTTSPVFPLNWWPCKLKRRVKTPLGTCVLQLQRRRPSNKKLSYSKLNTLHTLYLHECPTGCGVLKMCTYIQGSHSVTVPKFQDCPGSMTYFSRTFW